MDVTGSFKSLRNHVKMTKVTHSRPSAPSLRSQAIDDRAQEWQTEKPLIVDAVEQNQQKRWHEEMESLNAAREILIKEQREIKERERAVKSMEKLLEELHEQVSAKGASLDQRILEIARLESRLLDAVSEKTSPDVTVPPQVQVPEVDMEKETAMIEAKRRAIELQEQELILARNRIADREKHLSTKERALRDKEAELSNLQVEIDKKETERQRYMATLTKEMEAQYQTLSNELTTRFQRQMTDLHSDVESKRLFELNQVEKERIKLANDRAELTRRAAALLEQENAVVIREQDLELKHQLLQTANEHASMSYADAESRLEFLLHRSNEMDGQIARLNHAEAAVKLKEQQIVRFAEEVEAQHQYNIHQRNTLEAETKVQNEEAQPQPTTDRQPTRRSLKAAFFRSK